MMKCTDIAKVRTKFLEIEESNAENYGMQKPFIAHESTLRSCLILEKVKYLLKIGTPREVIFEMIDIMEGKV